MQNVFVGANLPGLGVFKIPVWMGGWRRSRLMLAEATS